MPTLPSSIRTIATDAAPAAVGAYSQATEYQGTFYFSGMLGLIPATGALANGFQAQMDQILSNIDGLLQACRLERAQIVKTTVFLTDLANFPYVNSSYQNFFQAPYPARSCVEVKALPKGALVEIEVIAVAPQH